VYGEKKRDRKKKKDSGGKGKKRVEEKGGVDSPGGSIQSSAKRKKKPVSSCTVRAPNTMEKVPNVKQKSTGGCPRHKGDRSQGKRENDTVVVETALEEGKVERKVQHYERKKEKLSHWGGRDEKTHVSFLGRRGSEESPHLWYFTPFSRGKGGTGRKGLFFSFTPSRVAREKKRL